MTGPILELRKLNNELADETVLINSRRQKAPSATSSKTQCSVASLFHSMGCRKKMVFWSLVALIGGRLNFANLSVQRHQIQSIILFHFWSAIHKFYMLTDTVPHIAGLSSPKISVSFTLSAILPSMFSQEKKKIKNQNQRYFVFCGHLCCFFLQQTKSEGFVCLLA